MSLLSRIAVEAARGFGMLARTGSPTNVPASYLVVAGGGGGASGGGGAGAGGYQTSTFTLSTLNTYSITVGAGGVGGVAGATSNGSNGTNSVVSGTGLSTVTSIGGGGTLVAGGVGNSGGSGGGGGGNDFGANSAGGAGTAGQGNNGGASFSTAQRGAGGGGGAGAVGGTGTNTAGGNGGNGLSSSISGSSVTYAGGGGGGSYSPNATTGGSGGTGGGGAGTGNGTTNATAGTTNLGGGGGGGGATSGVGYGNGGNGGSGIVIISYASATPKFVGGTLTTSGGNQIHTFTSSGTLSPLTPVTASYLVVAGGGAGGGNIGAGGGAGGLLTSSTTIYSGATYVVTVGAGGTASAGAGTNGSNSILSGTGITTVTSTGGGGGATENTVGSAGGSGGGGGSSTTTSRAGGAGTSGQGFAGGNNFVGGTNVGASGGGGGAGAVGTNGSSGQGGNGGVGLANSITGSSVFYAGGGGGSFFQTSNPSGGGSGGNGGGGASANTTSFPVSGTAGTPNTGGGGGGGSRGGGDGGNGGSGTVIISYAGSQVFNGGLVTSSGGNTIHTFNATGALTPLTNNLTNSLRFRSSASAYLNRTPTLAGNRKTWTWSAWVKLGKPSDFYALFGSTNNCFIGYGQSTGGANLGIADGNTSTMNVQTTALFRDPSAWYHIVFALDTTQATAANRVKIYVNGNQQTSFVTATYPTQNADFNINNTTAQYLGRTWDGFQYFDGYMTDINFIDGQALEPYYFGNNDANGVWKPIKYTGMYGTNGFYLTFGNTTSTTTIGYDSSPNGNNWATNNINLNTPINTNTSYDAMTDVPTNTSATVANYATMNPLELGDGAPAALSNGNLTITGSASLFLRRGTINFPLTGKYYCEFTVTAVGSGVSIAYDSRGQSGATQFIQYDNGGTKNINGTTSAYGASFTTGDVIAMAVDADGGSIAFYKNNTSQGSITFSSASMTGVNATAMVFAFTSAIVNANFGQRPFSYTPPTGYVALNTFNLPTPTILQGNKYMDATLWTGTGTSQVITNQGQFKPDFVWVKSRSNITNNTVYDSVRGFNASPGSPGLFTNLTDAEGSSTNTVSSANSNGFTISGSSNSLNTNAYTYVGWQWQAGQGTNTSNTSGSITSTVSVNATAGFSIVTYTGTGSVATVGHGLGVAPKWIVVKGRGNVDNWPVYQASANASPATGHLLLNTTAAFTSTSTTWNNTAPTSTVFTVGTDTRINQNTIGYVAYCWAEIAGFSKFGSYTGNASADGPFIYTGFRPKYILFKNSSTTSDWTIVDTSRSPYNKVNEYLFADLSSNEQNSGSNFLDILSNGFKIRAATSPELNGSGNTMIYAAFAENPFKNANAR
jgi:hypothetical protein